MQRAGNISTDRVKASLPNAAIIAYLDDIIIRSNTFEEHLNDLKNVFSIFEKYNLRANKDKCKFFCKEVKYLGHILTQKGISQSPDKLEAIKNSDPPRNLKQVMSFIQTCSWYRRFIDNLANIMQSPTKLIRKVAVWQWEHAQQSAFNKLRDLLSSSPILNQINVNLPFITKTDASVYAIGAVLSQGRAQMNTLSNMQAVC